MFVINRLCWVCSRQNNISSENPCQSRLTVDTTFGKRRSIKERLGAQQRCWESGKDEIPILFCSCSTVQWNPFHQKPSHHTSKGWVKCNVHTQLEEVLLKMWWYAQFQISTKRNLWNLRFPGLFRKSRNCWRVYLLGIPLVATQSKLSSCLSCPYVREVPEVVTGASTMCLCWQLAVQMWEL